MASPSEYCLRWNNHQHNLLDSFQTLLQDEAFCDVTLACDDGQIIRAHRLVLASCSTYFASLLSATSTQDHPIIILKDVRGQEMKEILSYMYRGSVNVENSRLNDLLKVGDSLKVKGLVMESSTARIDDNEEQIHPLPLITSSSGSSSSSTPSSMKSTPPPMTPLAIDTSSSPRIHSPTRPTSSDRWNGDLTRPLKSSSPRRRSPGLRPRSLDGISSSSFHHPTNQSPHSPPSHHQLLTPLMNSRGSFAGDILPSSGGGIRCARDLYEKDPSPRPSSTEDLKRLSPFIGALHGHHHPSESPPPMKRNRSDIVNPLVSPTPILRTALRHQHSSFSPDVSSLVSLANSMMPLPPLLASSTIPRDELKRLEEQERLEVRFLFKFS